MATKPDVELVAVTKRFGEAVAVDTVSLRIPAGSYCCLLGPSGCGKTTTLRMIAGHEEASEGDIILGSENITNLPPAAVLQSSAAAIRVLIEQLGRDAKGNANGPIQGTSATQQR